MGKWGKCRAEGRDHKLDDFKSQAVIHQGKLIGHTEVCRWCGKSAKELFKK